MGAPSVRTERTALAEPPSESAAGAPQAVNSSARARNRGKKAIRFIGTSPFSESPSEKERETLSLVPYLPVGVGAGQACQGGAEGRLKEVGGVETAVAEPELVGLGIGQAAALHQGKAAVGVPQGVGLLRREVARLRQRFEGEGRPVGPLLLPGEGHAGDAAAAVGCRHIGGVEAAVGEAVLPEGEAGLPCPADGAVDFLQLHAGELIELLEGQVSLLAGRQAEAALRGQHRVRIQGIGEAEELFGAEETANEMIAVYLFDETEILRCRQEINDQKMVAGLIYLDNYEEALESVEEVRRSLLIALIDRKINKYISGVDGICKKLEKDKYLVILRKKAIARLQETRFDILEEIKTVNIGNEMAVTASIGMGLDSQTYSQNCEYARTAIDLALGRGGDQAVIKTPQSIVYYGGKSQQVEKNTRVKARVKAQALQEIIATKHRVLIMGHRLPDADAIGSAVGISCIARAMDKKAHIVINESIASVKPLLDLFKDKNVYGDDFIINSSQALELAGNNTVLAVVDVNKPSITECPELIKECKTVVVLDHHRQGSEVIENATLSYVEPYASSACEMVAEVLQYVGGNVKVRSNEADCMYSGIIIDTNNFTAKTGVRTFEAAAFLRRCGADVTRVRKMFRDDAKEYKAKAEAVRNAEIYKNAYAIAKCPAEGLESPTVVGAQASNELLNINGIKASFVITDYQNKIYISARSIDEVNVQIIMERLGGGGHMNIAGAQLENVNAQQAVEIIKDTINTMLQEGAI